MLFDGLLEQLLKEATASVDNIIDAIDNHKKIIVTYKPVTKGREHATGPRLIGVFAYGTTKASNPCIRVFEYAGDSASFVPNWKFLRIDSILSWKDTGQTFDELPPSRYGQFNDNGDKTMSMVYKVAKFGNEELPQSDLKSGAVTTQDYQTDAEKKIRKRGEKIRQQFQNPITISDFKKQKGLEDYKDEPKQTSGPITADKVNNQKQDNLFKTDTEKRLERARKQFDKHEKIDLSKFDTKKRPQKPQENDKEIEDLRNKLGNTDKPIKFKDLNDKLKGKKVDLDQLKHKYGL